MTKFVLFPLTILLISSATTNAEVADSAANGFTIKQSYSIKATPDEVYRRFVKVSEWWNSTHTFSHDAKNLSLEDKALGCFCEKLPNGGGVRHMQVMYVAPGKGMLLSGAIGPMASLAAVGTMAIDFLPAEGGAKLNVAYSVAGYLSGGMASWAAPADGVLKEQFTRLKNLIERGDPDPK